MYARNLCGPMDTLLVPKLRVFTYFLKFKYTLDSSLVFVYNSLSDCL